MRFQNKVVTSTFTLPLTVIWSVMVSVVAGLYAHGVWASLPAIAASVYCMLEMNNHNVLLRVRSRMVSCSFLMLTVMCASANSNLAVAITQLCFAGAVFLLTFSYQDKKMVGVIFYASLLLSIASIFWIQALWLELLLFAIMFRPLYSFSFRGLNGAFFGLILPYVFYAAYMFVEHHDWMWWRKMFMPLLDSKGLLDYTTVTIGQLACFVLLVIISLFGTFHFISYSYQDKLRVRMLYWMYIMLAWLLTALTAVFPVYADYLLALMCIPIGVLAAHFFTHTSSRFTNISFIVVLILAMIITIFNQCLTSLSSMVLGAYL